MPGRILKPELFDDERTSSLSHSGFRLFIFLITHADNYGVVRAHPKSLQAAFGRTRTPSDCFLAELVSAGLVGVYRVRGQQYAHVTNFHKHQRIQHRGQPKYPGPEAAEEVARSSYSGKDVRRLRLLWSEVNPDSQLDLGLDQVVPEREKCGASVARPQRVRGASASRPQRVRGASATRDSESSQKQVVPDENFQNVDTLKGKGKGKGNDLEGCGEDGREQGNVVPLRLPRVDRQWRPPERLIGDVLETLTGDREGRAPEAPLIVAFVAAQVPEFVAWWRGKPVGADELERKFEAWMVRNWQGQNGHRWREERRRQRQVPGSQDDSETPAEREQRLAEAKRSRERLAAIAEAERQAKLRELQRRQGGEA